jgi:hypothetical protein
MAANTPNKNLYRPNNNDFINDWDWPMNTNWTGVDYALGGTNYIYVTGRSGTTTMGVSYSTISPYPPENVGTVGSPTSSITPSCIPSNIILVGNYTINLVFAVPAGVKGQWTVFNNATPSSSQTITFSVVGGTGVSIPVGKRAYVVSDGINVSYAQDPTITLGSTGLTLGTTISTVYNLTLEDSTLNNATIDDSTLNNATIPTGAIDVAAIDASGTPSSSNFLRGDGAWASPTSAIAGQFQPFDATGASNQITATLDPTDLYFRSNSYTAGETTLVSNSTAISITIPTDASFGASSGQVIRIAIVAVNNGGTMILAATNANNKLDEHNLIDTASITSAVASDEYYASVSVIGKAYRVVGYFDALWTSGTGWASPSLVQAAGGNALSIFGGIGSGQTWQPTTFVNNTVYYNTTGKPIFVEASWSPGAGQVYLSVDSDSSIGNPNIVICRFSSSTSSYKSLEGALGIIPANRAYKFTGDYNPDQCAILS